MKNMRNGRGNLKNMWAVLKCDMICDKYLNDYEDINLIINLF